MSVLEVPTLSGKDLKGIISGSTHRSAYEFINNSVILAGNTKWPIDNFNSIYERFQIDSKLTAETVLTIYYHHLQRADEDQIIFIAGEKAYRIRGDEAIANVFITIMYLILINIRSHYIFHAGALSRENQGLIIAGSTGMGKSTLTAYLSAGNLDFLSDELAPLDRNKGTIYPVPLMIGIRPGPGEKLTEGKTFLEFDGYDDPKKLIDIETLTGKRAADPALLRAVLFLTNDPSANVATPRKFKHAAKIILTATSEDFEKELIRTGELTFIRRESDHRLPAYHLETADPANFLEDLYDLLEKHNLSLSRLQYEDIEGPDFSKSPRLVKIPSAPGVIELFKKIHSHQKRELIDNEFGGKTSSMIRELTVLCRDVSFYKLTPGCLSEMISMVEGII